MNITNAFSSLIHPKPKTKAVFLSLILNPDSVQAAVWEVTNRHEAVIIGIASSQEIQDAWEERIEAADAVISQLNQKHEGVSIEQVVFGLPLGYLTESGDIQASIRAHIKKLSQMLLLKPIGYVALPQAIVNTLKKDDGIPPSVILIGVTKQSLAISLYRVGGLVGQKVMERSSPSTESVEEAIKSFRSMEVLPSRMLLYGTHESGLDSVRSELLRHPWSTKVNFLHFPKIEIFPVDATVKSVSLAGASELATTIGSGDGDVVPEVVISETKETAAGMTDESKAEESVGDEPTEDKTLEELIAEDDVRLEEGVAEGTEEGRVADEAQEEPSVSPAGPLGAEEEQESNVRVVSPEELGFTAPKKQVAREEIKHEKADRHEEAEAEMQEEAEKKEEELEEEEEAEDSEGRARGLPFSLPTIAIPSLSSLAAKVKGMPIIALGAAFGILILTGLVAVWVAFSVLPKATLNVLVLPQKISESQTITIDPQLTAVDPEKLIIPAQKQEKSVTGEKTVKSTGKKTIGDPAKGSVTIYNKVTAQRNFKKGALIQSGSLQFTLDDEVSVASASETIGSITFGKAAAKVTAVQIGENSNLAANTEFSFKDFPVSSVIARNDAAFSGGTSRQVTVVSRTDYDGIVKALTDELVGKAKTDLTGSVTGDEVLIDSTVKTIVTDKSFTKELGQEASELGGKVTISVTGLSYKSDDAKSLLLSLIEKKTPPSYVLSQERTTVAVEDVKVKKDGKLTVLAKIQGVAVPQLVPEEIARAVAGQNITKVQEYLRSLPGVAGMEVTFERAIKKDGLPGNRKNISVRIVELSQ